MNFYALNTAPINGWETQFGSGQAELTMLASGVSANVDLGAGVAQLSLSASGDGTRRVPASGSASMQLQAAGDGTRWVLGAGTATMQMAADGNGDVVSGVGGKISMVMHAGGIGGILVQGAGLAQMRIDASGDGRAATGRYGTGHGIMESRAWDIPKRYSTYHGSGTDGMWLAAFGAGNLIAANGGAATARLQLEGFGRVGERVNGSGAMALRLQASNRTSSQHRQIRAGGAAIMAMRTSTRDNRVVMLPDGFYPAPKARGMRVSNESRAMRVPKQHMAQQPAEA